MNLELRILRSETVEHLLGNEGPSAKPFLIEELRLYFIQEKVPCYALDEAFRRPSMNIQYSFGIHSRRDLVGTHIL